MDLDVPTDLINKAQIGFREAAGLLSFDRKNTSLPSIPTVESSISTLDPSPPHLRCIYCHGKLLRGEQSLICIYCGQYQRNDRNPDPISFNSTHGYSWLLQSLNFNGSERIGSLAEGSGINGGQSPAEDELTLSELLDLKLIWRDVPKKPEINFHISTYEHSSSLNLGSTDFDSFFTESKRAALLSDIPEEQPVASKNDLNQAFEGQENMTSATSSIVEHDDASFGWNAEFQSADVKMENEKPKSTELFEGAEADLSTQMDAVFGPMEGFSNKKPNDNLDPIQDDLFANMKSASFQQAEQLDSVVQEKDNLSGHLNDVNSKDLEGDWFSDGNWQKNSAKNTLGKPNDDLDPLKDDLFANMKSASFQQAEQLDSVVQAKDNLSRHHNDVNSNDLDGDWFGDSNWQKNSAENTFGKPNDDLEPFQDDLFTNMKSASFQQAEQLDSVQAKDNLSGHQNDVNSKDLDGDWFSDGNWQKNSAKNTLGKPNDDLDPFKDDLFANMKSASFKQAEQLDSVVQAKDNLSGHQNDVNSKDLDGDWFGDGNWQKNSAENTLGKPNDGLEPFQDDLFTNMKSASFHQAEQLDSVVPAKDTLSGHRNDANPKDLDGDWFGDGNWQKSSPENTLGKPNDSSIDWFENTKRQDSSTIGKTSTIKDDHLFDIKPQVDLILSEKSDLDNSDKHHSDTTTDWFQDSQWVTGGSSSTTNKMANNGDDDGFDEWNDFTSSTENQAPSQDSWQENFNEKVGTSDKISDVNFFPSTADPQEVDFGNFSQSNIFSDDKTSNDTRVAYDIFSEVSTASRHTNAVAGNRDKGTKDDEIIPNATVSAKNDVQMLLSQMHDLSFMLKSELSFPSKADDLGPSNS